MTLLLFNNNMSHFKKMKNIVLLGSIIILISCNSNNLAKDKKKALDLSIKSEKLFNELQSDFVNDDKKPDSSRYYNLYNSIITQEILNDSLFIRMDYNSLILEKLNSGFSYSIKNSRDNLKEIILGNEILKNQVYERNGTLPFWGVYKIAYQINYFRNKSYNSKRGFIKVHVTIGRTSVLLVYMWLQ